MTSLKTFSYEMGPTIASGIVWSNFTVVHSTLETIRYVVRPYLDTSLEVFKHLPNLKRVEMMFRNDFRYKSLKHITD